MNVHIFPLSKGGLDAFKKVNSIAVQPRNAAIDNREGQKLNAVFPANVPFFSETQVFCFVRCQKLNNSIEPSSAPSLRFLFEPVPATRPS